METQLRKDILAFLTPLPSMQTENGRRALLLSAGLDAILAQTDLSGPPGVSVPLLVNTLELYGTIESGEPALIAFLQEIARQVGQDKQRQIQDFCERLQKGQPVPQQSRISEQQTPTGEQGQPITAQRDYFEQVGGNVYTGLVNIYQGVVPGKSSPPASQEPIQKEPVAAEGQSRKETRISAHKTSPEEWDVFICYAREDLAVARRVYGDLQQAGVKPWMDSEDLLPGQNWKLVIKRVIKESTYLIALLSSRSLSKRGFVHKEIREAWNVVDELPPEEIFIIPVRLDECTPKEERLQDLHHVDLFPSYEEGLQRILRSINVLE